MQFAFAKVQDKTTRLTKFVLVNWVREAGYQAGIQSTPAAAEAYYALLPYCGFLSQCGGSVPMGAKNRFTQHAGDVSRVLSG